MYFKEFSCKTGGGFRLRKICKQDACRDLFSASLIIARIGLKVNTQRTEIFLIFLHNVLDFFKML